MTIEQIERKATEYGIDSSAWNLIEEIVTDFKSRTCENCKWYYEPRKNCKYGYCKKLLDDEEFRVDDKKFGCLKFERKER